MGSESPGDDVSELILALSDVECRVVLNALSADGKTASAVALLAAMIVGSVDVDSVSETVSERVSTMSHFEIGERSGRQAGGGYVDPMQAAWDLVEEAVEPWIVDVERRAQLGCIEAAGVLAVAVVEGLRRCLPPHVETVLDWVPDAPETMAHDIVGRAEACGVVLDAGELARVAPDWF